MTSTLEGLRDLGVATAYEASGRSGLVDADLIQVLPGSRAAGPARIARCHQGDNRAVHAVMTVLQPGEVLVLAMPQPEPVALVGALLATQAAVRGAAAVLVDAAVRDVDELRELGLPVWSRWVRVAGASKEHRGRLDASVEVGGARINPGDIVVLDSDGAVVVASENADQVLANARQRHDREAAMLPRLAAGELSYDIHGLRARDQHEAVG
ncbi:MAG: dimethylmenaquinone methyltransferase [Micromonosporaceae bacterium]|nr:dimethylmenaquinone methyltransferase [Micromonosporaceae bacterium]